jgi:hypothetical protein
MSNNYGSQNGYNNRRGNRVEFSILEHLAVLENYQSGWAKEANIVTWNGGAPKVDIREWDPAHEKMSKGVTLFEKEAEKGLPIVLVCHIPPYSPRLFDVAMRVWRKGAYLCGVPDEKMGRYAPGELKQQRTDALTRDFLARLRSEPLLRAVLCGHIHKTSFDRFSPTAYTCVAGPNYMGEAQLVSFA